MEPLQYKLSWETLPTQHWTISFRSRYPSRRIGTFWFSSSFVYTAEAASVPEGYHQFVQAVLADLETDPKRVRPEFPRARVISDNTGHADVAALAKSWLQTCKEKHCCEEACGTREPGWYPKRLLDVGHEHQSPRLLLQDTDHLDGPYAALSHCWGPNPEFLMLSSTNLEELRREIPLQHLPASFRDAIVTCRRLTIPYLWIDSLCILQSGPGSREDWVSQSLEMHRVYLCCELNISIDAASSPHEGAFRSRDPRSLQDCFVWTPSYPPRADPVDSDSNGQHDEENPTETETSRCGEPETGSELVYRCAVFNWCDFDFARQHLPLSKRGWVLQERLMSPRTLHFQRDRIAWECDMRRSLSEYMPDSAASQVPPGFECLSQSGYNIPSFRHESMPACLHSYYTYVIQYTSRKLSHPKADKLIAFSTIARRYAEWIEGDYCAGIFRNTMPWGLLWEGHNSGAESLATYRAPSWSWASLDHEVYFRPKIHVHQPTTFVEVLDVSVELEDPSNEFGQVLSASLTLKGPLVPSEFLTVASSTKLRNEDFLLMPWATVMTRVGSGVTVVPDEVKLMQGDGEVQDRLSTWFSSTRDLFFLAVGEVPKRDAEDLFGGTYGLLVQRQGDGMYRRVALWRGCTGLVSGCAGTACEFQTETITIA